MADSLCAEQVSEAEFSAADHSILCISDRIYS